jgi:hypothetical protein
MSAVLTRRRQSGRGRERDHRQPSLFSQVVAPPPARADEPVVATPVAPAAFEADQPRATLTLDEAISGLWGDLTSGETADCPLCGSAMLPRHTASAGVVGGRCGSCATTLA